MRATKLNISKPNQEKGLLQILKSHVIISITDTLGRLVYVNDNFCKIMGYNQWDLIGETHVLLKSELHSDPFYKNLWETIKKGKVWNGVLCNHSSSGKLYWLETTITPVKDSTGQIIKYVATYVDITDCYEDNNKYREKASHLSTFTKSIPNTIVSINRLGEILNINKKIGKLDVDQIIGKPLYNFINPAYHEKVRKEIRLVFNHGEPGQYETIEFNNEGSQIFQISIIGPVFNDSNEVISATISSQDVKNVNDISIELLANEARYRAIFKSIDVGIIVVTNDKGDIIEWNKGAELAFGYTEHEILGNPLSCLISEKHKKESIQELLKAIRIIKRKSSKDTIEMYGLKKNGVEFPVEFALSKWKIDKQPFYCAMMLDITNRKALENKLKVKTKDLKLFLYRSAHDLKAPFSSAEGLLNLIRHEKISKEVVELINMLNTTLARGKLLTDNLSLASILSEKNSIASLINFEKLIDNTISTFNGTENFNNIKFEIFISETEKFYSTVELLNSLFQNLIQNAIKYSSIKNVDIDPFIKIEVYTSNEGATITIKDNGQGISENNINKIFDLYFRANTYDVPGSGLGLYIVKNIIDDLNGEIKVISELKKGTTFEINLPHLKPQKIE